jgi:hypothetical protein
MEKPSRIPVELVAGEVMVRALNGQDMLLVQQAGSAANAPFAIALANRLTNRDGSVVAWTDVERVLLAAYILGHEASPELVADCPDCATRIEICPDLREVLAQCPKVTPETSVQGWHILCRIPSARAMERASFSAPRLAIADLSAEIVVAVYGPDGELTTPEAVPEDILNAAFVACNAVGFMILSLTCPDCTADIDLRLDPLAMIRAEAARVKDISRTADALSQKLDWPLSAVLALPEPQRRGLARLIEGNSA